MAVLLAAGDLRRVLDWDSVFEAVSKGFVDFSGGLVDQPQRTVLRGATMPGVYVLMPCAIPSAKALGTKLAGIFPGNPARGHPTISALYVLAEFDTGRTLAVMDAGYLTAYRTAVASAVATRALALADAKSMGLFGTGTQAEFHARAFAHFFPALRMKVCGTSREKADAFVARLGPDISICLADSPADAAGCDIVVAATSGTQPLFDGRALRPGAHVNGVGSHSPKIRELDSEAVARSRVIGDSREAVFAEAGDILLPIEEGRIGREHVVAELGEVLGGRCPGRISRADITLFKSNGIAFQDAVTARIAFERAAENGLGTEFDFGA